MTEEEYIVTTALVRARSALAIMGEGVFAGDVYSQAEQVRLYLTYIIETLEKRVERYVQE